MKRKTYERNRGFMPGFKQKPLKKRKMNMAIDITKDCQDMHGKDLVPAHFPEPFKTSWDKMYATKMWDSDYPFRRDNIEDFAKFCLQSGGFTIC